VLERQVMTSHRWWTPQELADCPEPYFPTDLLALWAALPVAPAGKDAA
jgi:hypothetical protein